ncbi:PadR family transcriptional regulator [Fodinicola feengrottensis]|uniref:PadR family transcriptional regulator n=2 Tax=Fodinicola feengrottensis TaxID=435914 RepID=A0ABP4RJG8_9ACTN|nr:PadR family transcriptional regulator [Fodinicola feengrottensis]
MSSKRSTLGLTVLGTLAGEPMHAYRIQKTIKEHGKDRVVNVRQRASIYQAIERLLRLGLIEVQATARPDSRPERTVYAITDAGMETAREWIHEMLIATENEFPEFPVGVSFIMALTPAEAKRDLQARADAIAIQINEIAPWLGGSDDVPRLYVLEEEYRHAVLSAELKWLRTVISDLESGRITWTWEWLQENYAAFKHKQGDTEDGDL